MLVSGVRIVVRTRCVSPIKSTHRQSSAKRHLYAKAIAGTADLPSRGLDGDPIAKAGLRTRYLTLCSASSSGPGGRSAVGRFLATDVVSFQSSGALTPTAR